MFSFSDKDHVYMCVHTLVLDGIPRTQGQRNSKLRFQVSSNFIVDFVDKKTVQKMTEQMIKQMTEQKAELTEMVQRVSIDAHIKKSGYLSSTSCKEYHDNLVETKLSTFDLNLFF